MKKNVPIVKNRNEMCNNVKKNNYSKRGYTESLKINENQEEKESKTKKNQEKPTKTQEN